MTGIGGRLDPGRPERTRSIPGSAGTDVAKKRAHRSNALKTWDDARRQFRLSSAHLQMARDLGMKPSTLGMLASTGQQRWKLPLRDFIARQHEKRFGRRLDTVSLLEDMAMASALRTTARPDEALADFEGRGPPPADDVLIPEGPDHGDGDCDHEGEYFEI